jgi:DNA-binding PadR family transcriptional regulator
VSDSVGIKSTVTWAVLALVIERPSYGYELGQRFERRFAGVLEPQVSQIYAALSSLERAQLVEPLSAAECAAPALAAELAARPAARQHARVHYRATEEGERAFHVWFADQLRADPPHRDLLQRLAASAGMGIDQLSVMTDLIDNYERACVEEASRLPLRMRDTTEGLAPEDLIERLVVGARRALLDARHEWIAYARREVGAFAGENGARCDEPAGA